MVRRLELSQGLVRPAKPQQDASALYVNRRLRRAVLDGPLQRPERRLVATELALRLRDPQPAQPVLGIGLEQLAIFDDGVFPAPFLERDLRRLRDRQILRTCCR